MSLQNDIDSASEEIIALVEKARLDLLTDLYNIKRTMTLGSFIEIVSTIDLENTLKNKLKKATAVYANAHRNVLSSTIGFGKVDGSILTGLARLNEQLFDGSIVRVISGHIRTQVVKGVQAGLSLTEIADNIVDASISNAQMQTLVNTSLNSYSRQVTNQMMSIAPKTTKYVYIGPVDDRTRDECLDMASAGALTLDQIVSQFGEAPLVDGGGFNCRHKWEIASDEGLGFNEQEKAEKRLGNA